MHARLRTSLRLIAGGAFWVLAGLLAVRGLAATELGRSISERLRAHVVEAPRTLEIDFPASARLAAGAPVRIERGRALVQVGTVRSLSDEREGIRRAEILLFPDFEVAAASGGTFLAHETDGDIEWILRTLLPEEVQAKMQATFRRRWDREHAGLLRDLEPGLSRLAEDLTVALRDDLDRVMRTHDADFRRLGEVLMERGWDGPVEDAVRERVWPRLRERATPLIAEVGNEMIDAFPVGSTAWDLVVDKLPFSEERRVRERLRRFADKTAIPILERREADFRRVALEVLDESTRDPEIRASLGEAARRVAEDARFRSAILSILRTWVVQNDRVATIARGLWDRDDLREPVLRFLRRFEPDIHRLANEIILDDDGRGLDPELARVLRRKIMRDDQRWILFRPSTPDEPRTFRGVDGGVR